MDNARFVRCLVLLLATAAAGYTVPAAAQVEPPELTPYLQVISAGTGIPYQFRIKNLYSSPIVALSASSHCTIHPENARARSMIDSALWYATPYLYPGRSRILSTNPDCATAVAAVVFADGKAVGDQDEINQIYRRRVYAVEEIDHLLKDDIGPQTANARVAAGRNRISAWDPEASIEFLKARRPGQHVTGADQADEFSTRHSVQRHIIERMQAFEKTLSADPKTAEDQKKIFTGGLLRWRECLTSKEFVWMDDFHELLIPIPPGGASGGSK
jgi:hypothetical protein